MKVKSYTAGSMQEAMAQVKTELGRDAVILHTKRYRKGGILGFFGKEVVEVMAAVDSAAPKAAEKKVVLPPPRSSVEDSKVTAMQLELATMRKMIEQVLVKMPKQAEALSPFMNILLKNDIERPIAENLLQGLVENQALSQQNPALIQKLLSERIGNYFHKVDGIKVTGDACKTVALIGPTGVGKTTTVAKLAANFSLKQGFKVALITADTYRIAAVDQLKTYADIIGVPLEIVYSPDELKAAIYRHHDKNLILVDTAGRSPANQYHLAELQALLAVDPYIETHLVLGTNTKYKDALAIVDKFSICSPQKFLFTKVDESTNIGIIFNLLYHFPTAISYITTGQNVPDDIELADPQKLVNLILKE